MLEIKIEERLCNGVKKIGGKAYKLISQGNAGLPDRLVCFPGGRIIFVELKRPKGGRLSPLQECRITELRHLGFDVRVLCTSELVDSFLREVKDGEI